MEKRLLTVTEGAVYLGISRSLLYIYVMNRQIPSIKIGRARRISVDALDVWVTRQVAEEAADEQP